jgi:hypothetical protein
MAIENYILIVACYSFGCYTAYRLGISKGAEYGVECLLDYLSRKTGKSIKQLSEEFLK